MNTKRLHIVVLLFASLYGNMSRAQYDNTKAFLFLSVFCEEANSYFEQSADFIKEFHTWYDNFSYEKYTIQLFKINKSSHSPIYYTLKISSCNTYRFSFTGTLWIRLSGYRESDIKVFFDALRKQGVKKREIVEMVKQWCNSDEMFRELNWDCLLKGYFKNNTHFSCYISRANMWYLERFSGEDTSIYADFSKRLLSGTLHKFD